MSSISSTMIKQLNKEAVELIAHATQQAKREPTSLADMRRIVNVASDLESVVEKSNALLKKANSNTDNSNCKLGDCYLKSQKLSKALCEILDEVDYNNRDHQEQSSQASAFFR